jgi:prepilin-type N-terminal cleavage/methylation domain-containing protein
MKARADRGFSLLEIMIAVVVIAIALMGILSATIHTSTTKESLREMEVAKQAASRKIDELRGLPWGAFSTPVAPSIVNTYVNNYIVAGSPGFPFTPTITTMAPFPVEGLSYSKSIAADPWNTPANNPMKLGKGTIILHGVNPVPIVDPVLLVDFEVQIEWTGVHGAGKYTARMILSRAKGG